MAVAEAVDLAVMASEMMVATAPAVMRDGVQRPAVLGIGWWQVASASEMTGLETASVMAEAMSVMVVAAAAAVAGRRSWMVNSSGRVSMASDMIPAR